MSSSHSLTEGQRDAETCSSYYFGLEDTGVFLWALNQSIFSITQSTPVPDACPVPSLHCQDPKAVKVRGGKLYL